MLVMLLVFQLDCVFIILSMLFFMEWSKSQKKLMSQFVFLCYLLVIKGRTCFLHMFVSMFSFLCLEFHCISFISRSCRIGHLFEFRLGGTIFVFAFFSYLFLIYLIVINVKSYFSEFVYFTSFCCSFIYCVIFSYFM